MIKKNPIESFTFYSKLILLQTTLKIDTTTKSLFSALHGYKTISLTMINPQERLTAVDFLCMISPACLVGNHYTNWFPAHLKQVLIFLAGKLPCVTRCGRWYYHGPIQMPRVLMWGLSLYCCVSHRCCTAEQRLRTLGNESCSLLQMGHTAKRGCSLAREGWAALLDQGAACFTGGGSCATPPKQRSSHFWQRRCSDWSTCCQNE